MMKKKEKIKNSQSSLNKVNKVKYWHVKGDAFVLTLGRAVHDTAAVQQVVCQRERVSQAEKISQFAGGEAGVLRPFAQVNHCPREPLFGHLSLEYPLLNSACREATHAET